MRNSPFLGFIVLIAVAIGVLSYTAHLRPAPDRLPSEQPDPPPTTPTANQVKPKALNGSKPSEPPPTFPSDAAARAAYFEQYKQGARRATMEIEGKGKIVLELYPAAAPKTVEHFVKLCSEHFYDGVLFHRVVPGFVAQGGDPTSKKLKPEDLRGMDPSEAGSKYGLGHSGSGTTVPLEAKLPHIIYGLGEARANDPDSGDSQFYINLADLPNLDGQYCVFGRVIEGQDVASKLEMGDRITSLTAN